MPSDTPSPAPRTLMDLLDQWRREFEALSPEEQAKARESDTRTLEWFAQFQREERGLPTPPPALTPALETAILAKLRKFEVDYPRLISGEQVARGKQCESLASYRQLSALLSDRDRWQREYINVYKCATDYERQRDALRERVKAFEEGRMRRRWQCPECAMADILNVKFNNPPDYRDLPNEAVKCLHCGWSGPASAAGVLSVEQFAQYVEYGVAARYRTPDHESVAFAEMVRLKAHDAALREQVRQANEERDNLLDRIEDMEREIRNAKDAAAHWQNLEWQNLSDKEKDERIRNAT